jgi:hypothetical protein
MADSRICKVCGVLKDKSFFAVGAAKCKPCYNAIITARRRKQRETYLAANPKPIRTTKHCKPCGRDLPFDEFYRNAKTGWVSGYCKPCQKRMGTAHRLRHGRNTVKEACDRLHATVAWFYAQREKQNNLCALCQTPESNKCRKSDGELRSLSIDHDHETGRIRELLCFRCNTALRQLEKHGIGWADRAVEYLKKYQE